MKKNTLHLLLLIPIFSILFSCGGGANETADTKDTVKVETKINEFELLIAQIEKNGDFINSKKVPTMITATKVKSMLDSGLYVIDIRKKEDYESGHIKGAVNVKSSEILEYLKTITPSDYKKIVLACYSGQTASYTASLLQIYGYSNVYVLKWGMSSLDKKMADKKWLKNKSDKFADKLETTANPKGEKGEYPTISTGLKTGKEILESRIEQLLKDGFKPKKIKSDEVFNNKDKYYIVNYWPAKLYNIGHLPSAIQYNPKKSLGRSTELSTLPKDKTIVVYCFTGQHSAFVTAYLTLLGYDVRSLVYGANGFMNSMMIDEEKGIGHGFSKKKIEKCDLVK